MEPATLYLIYVAATGGPEKRVVTPFASKTECEDSLTTWRDGAQKSKRYTLVRAACLHPTDYAPDWRSTYVIVDDSLDPKHRP